MRAIKRISHNAAICEDGAGHQLIALGRGIGFGDMPHEVALDDVQRTFYGIDPKYLSFIGEVDPEILEFSAQLADIVTQQVSYELSPNLPITLADHIQFALQRAREHLVVPMPLAEDVEQAHPVEYRLGEMAVRGMQKTFNVRVDRHEASGVALSIVNAAVAPSQRRALATKREERLLEHIAEALECEMGSPVDRSSFAYARFTTHIRYLIDRVQKGEPIESENSGLYSVLAEQYPRATVCAHAIATEVEATYGDPVTEEELVYLIMHINRIAPPLTDL